MPRFGKKGLRGYSRAGVKAKPRKAAPRRRLQPGASAALAAGGLAIGKRVYNRYKAYKKTANASALRSYNSRIEQSDNIVTVPSVVVGKQRKIGFQEKVSKSFRPPLMFKRNYAFSAECVSGRKGWFSLEINNMNTDVNTDITTYRQQMFTDTATADATIGTSSPHDNSRFYIDYHSEKVQMMNSSSNGIIGKIHLVAHKRDNDNVYAASTTPITPINMMAYYSTNSLPALTAGSGAESTVGNGWAFNTTAGNTNYAGVYNMPGSSVNASGNTLSTDPELKLFSPHIKDKMAFWFRVVSSKDFTLKPGQQFNSSYIFNDLPKIFREEQQEYIHLAGVSFSLVVEFKAGMVGSAVSVTGNNVISTGDAQLSVIRESKRIIGQENTLRSKTVLQTTPLASIAIESQVIINSDTGVGLTGTVVDA